MSYVQCAFEILVYVSSVKCSFRIHFSLTWRYNVTDYTHTRNNKTHFIEDTVYTLRIMRNIQCFIINAFVESSTYPVYAQQCLCMSWEQFTLTGNDIIAWRKVYVLRAIHTNVKWYHCMKKGITANIFYTISKISLSDKLLEYHSYKRERERAAESSAVTFLTFSIENGVFNQIKWRKNMYIISLHR